MGVAKGSCGAQARHLGAALVLALAASGCNYNSGIRLPEHYQTVGIEIFDNESFEIDIERDVHAELSRWVTELVRAPISVPGRADVVMDGAIEEYTRRGGIRGEETNRLLESAVVVRARAWLYDSVTGDPIGDPAQASTRIGYAIDQEGGELQARRRAIRDVAQRLVLDLFTSLD